MKVQKRHQSILVKRASLWVRNNSAWAKLSVSRCLFAEFGSDELRRHACKFKTGKIRTTQTLTTGEFSGTRIRWKPWRWRHPTLRGSWVQWGTKGRKIKEDSLPWRNFPKLGFCWIQSAYDKGNGSQGLDHFRGKASGQSLNLTTSGTWESLRPK